MLWHDSTGRCISNTEAFLVTGIPPKCHFSVIKLIKYSIFSHVMTVLPWATNDVTSAVAEEGCVHYITDYGLNKLV